MTPTLLRHKYEVRIGADEIAKALGLPEGDWRIEEAQGDGFRHVFIEVYRVEDEVVE